MTTIGIMRRDSSFNHMARRIKYRNLFTNPMSPAGKIHSTLYDIKADAISGAEYGEREWKNEYIAIAVEVFI